MSLTIKTNLSSLMAQNSFKTSTSKLNQAIERMSSGAKINHAKDNSANYSIATNYSTKLSALQVAEDNVSMGLDFISTANDVLATMQDHATRLQALSIQARNGTYDTSSISAIRSEASAITTEIEKLYSSAEYNKITLFDRLSYSIKTHFNEEECGLTTDLTPKYNGFIENPVTYSDAEVAAMTRVADADTFYSQNTYSISTTEELVKLADYISANKYTSATFVLAEDIDLSSIDNWTPIGSGGSGGSNTKFFGTFDGNGHVIKNLTINDETKSGRGFFKVLSNATVKNLGIVDAYVKGNRGVGILTAETIYDSQISNCYVSGEVYGDTGVGGFVGNLIYAQPNSREAFINCYSTANVTADREVGGLAGNAENGKITNCFATGNITSRYQTGGLVGLTKGCITNCYATGDVNCTADYIGGLIGDTRENATITNCYATGNVKGGTSVGGLVGAAYYSTAGVKEYKNCYATGNVTGDYQTGSLIGYANSAKITNCHATGNANGISSVGGIIGYASGFVSVSDCYTTGDIEGTGNWIGGLIGEAKNLDNTQTISNCISYSTVTGNTPSTTGSFIGRAILTDDGTTYGTLSISRSEVIAQDKDFIAGIYKNSPLSLLADYDISEIVADLHEVDFSTTFHIGINGDNSCSLNFDTNFTFDISAIESDIASDTALTQITDFINLLSEQQTKLGSVQNRLESALDEISIQYDNLVSSRSTIQDADIAEISAEYIKMQILQQASATLIATANQSPSIALNLL